VASRRIEDLDPRVQDGAKAILRAWADKGLDVLVTATFRSMEEQDRLYRQGRDGHPGPRVTNAKAGQSLHNHGRAMDVVPLVNGKALWDAESPLWRIMYQVARQADPRISWGGNWSGFKDWPHYEWLLRDIEAPALADAESGGSSTSEEA
jgi:peptidoglycan L-alanyl-D-glutamate endopeptidase CwlK